jgi:TonB family protein
MSLLVDAAIKTSLILLFALMAVFLLRRRSAAMRHWLLAVAIACVAIAPLLTPVAPSWQMRLDFLSWPSEVGLSSPAGHLAGSARRVRTQQGAAFEAPSTARADEAVAATTGGLSAPLRLVRAAYVIVAALNLCVLLAGLGRLARLAAGARPLIGGPWAEMAREIARDCGLRREVVLLQSDHPSLLMTWGVFRPKLFLPAGARNWSRHRMQIVLGHELAHVRRGDWLVQISADLLRCVYWFNPLLWITCRRLRFEGEKACDDAVLTGGVEGSTYASHVLDLARTRVRSGRASATALAMVNRSGLERRIHAMLNARLDRRPLTRTSRLLIAIVLSSITLPVSGLCAAGQASPGRFSGWIVDQTGAAIADATVSAIDAQTATTQETSTDTRGYFEYVGLPAGDYRVEVAARGFAPSRAIVRLEAGSLIQRNIRLQLGSVRETVTVAGGASATVEESSVVAEAVVSRDRGEPLQPPVKVKDVRPAYPQRLVDAGIHGSVTLEGRIGADGVMTNVEVIPPANPELAEAALDAVRQWRFEPTRLHGVAVDTSINVTVDFLLRR